ncbi:hypothetical protein Agub_g10379 [Astrephomene gubernaculifera]|uniref:CRAL-TRIO domain-containing protein n=1 Tax=Astrephomene gubernaculifera TaxID=47775 RepID=A0AAD3HPN2_9CHLO|nr:hypothetical protein Agub_g10379 [Astrephomene gubernaculifera]
MALVKHGFPIESRDLTAEQLTKLRAFKHLLQQTGSWDDARFDDHDCARFLKARQYDVQAAKQMWDAMLAWRKENRVDNIHDWFVFKERAEYDRVFPTGLHKTDKEGHPILIQQLGRVNIGALYKVTNDERIRLAHVAENEHLRRVVFPACSRAAGRPIDQLFTIIDLEGVAFTGMMRTTSLLKMFMAMDSNNYPETLSRMAIINAPGWFSTSWGAVKSVLSGDTVKKIEILGKDYKEALLRHIHPDNLLFEYGGTSRGSVTANTGPWQDPSLLEPLPEPPAPPPLVPPPLPLTPAGLGQVEPLVDTQQAVVGGGSGGVDQRTPRDAQLRRSQSPVRPGAKTPAGVVGGVGGPHQAPAASPPDAKRIHLDATSQPSQQPSLSPSPAAQGQGSSPAPSVSDTSSDIAQNMAAPLLSNFLPASDSPLHQKPLSQPLLVAESTLSPPPPRGLPLAASSMQSAPSQPGPARRTGSAGGAPSPAHAAAAVVPGGLVSSGLTAGLVAGIQAAVSHAGYQPQHSGGSAGEGVVGAAAAAALDAGLLHPSAGGSPAPSAAALGAVPPRSTYHTPLPATQQQHQQQAVAAAAMVAGRALAVGPTQLQVASPREEVFGAETMLSAASTLYSMRSAMSPMSPMDAHMIDMVTSRAQPEGVAGPVLARASAGFAATVTSTQRRISGSGGSGVLLAASGPSVTLGSGQPPQQPPGAASNLFGGAVVASGELPPGPAQPLQQQDTDDADSVRFSVMSQRSFYSALSHVDPGSSSGLTSPSEASDYARRWSVQRELHAAAIASALAATAEQRRIAAAAAAASLTPLAVTTTAGKPPGGPSAAATSAVPALPGVSFIVPPASQQAFGSYLDQPPSYRAVAVAEGPSNGNTVSGSDLGSRHGADVSAGAEGAAGTGAAAASTQGLKGSASRGELAVFGSDVIIHVGTDVAGVAGSSLSRSHSAAAMDECSLGAGAVRWARGWFFRRRNYGRLMEPESLDASGGMIGLGSSNSRGGSSGGGAVSADGSRPTGAATHARKGSAGATYSSIKDGPGSTSPSKMLPKAPSVPHHARGDSWEWDQPSPYDIDQTYGRSVGGSAMHRDMSFGRGAERRRLLRSESPGRRRGMLKSCCGCLPGCTIM